MSYIQNHLPARPDRATAAAPGNEALWAVLRDLRDCQPAYGLKSRDLETLSVLVSFLKGQNHRMVFASNRSILERMNGVSVKTLQRAISRLVEAGMITRRDSPNGKRFAFRHRGGDQAVAFGFDLSPLDKMAPEISCHAEAYRAESDRVHMLKLRLRHLLSRLEAALPSHSMIHEMRRALRRKLCSDQIEILADTIEAELPYPAALPGAVIHLEPAQPAALKMTCSGGHSDAHHHKSDTDEKDKKRSEQKEHPNAVPVKSENNPINLLSRVMKACPEAMSFCPATPRDWPELRSFSTMMAAWIGISPDVLEMSRKALGDDRAALTILCILESTGSIRRPSAYLRSLSTGARAAGFDPMRWLNRLSARGALSVGCRPTPA